jgi:hypothetical protein
MSIKLSAVRDDANDAHLKTARASEGDRLPLGLSVSNHLDPLHSIVGSPDCDRHGLTGGPLPCASARHTKARGVRGVQWPARIFLNSPLSQHATRNVLQVLNDQQSNDNVPALGFDEMALL